MKYFKYIIPVVIVVFLVFFTTLLGFYGKTSKTDITRKSSAENSEPVQIPKQIIDIYLSEMIADGFDFPVGDPDGKGAYTSTIDGKSYSGWYIAVRFGEDYAYGIHPGEDWNGLGGGKTDLGQSVFSIGKGIVIFASNLHSSWGKTIIIRHLYLENAKLKTIFSLYTHLDEIFVSENDTVERRGKIATIGDADGFHIPHLHFEIRKENMKNFSPDYWPSSDGKDLNWIKVHYESPSIFINNHRKCLAPYLSNQMTIAEKNNYKLYHIRDGKLYKTYEIALSQNPVGHKQKQGDNRLPEGEYRVIQKLKGPIGGDLGEFFGTAWIRLNYPNNFDAIHGFQKGVISEAEQASIIRANNNGQWPPKTTALGGGIGIHGWAGEWENDGNRHLTWGCISMHNYDLESFFEEIDLYDLVLILP